MTHKILQPTEWMRPKGYANGIAASGTQVFIAGQVGAALCNIVRVLEEAGGRPEHLVRLTWYVTSRREYLDEIQAVGAAYRAVMGGHFPAMSVVEVSALIESEARVEIEATAVVPAP